VISALKGYKRTNLMLDLKAPKLVLPCSVTDGSTRALVIDLGHLLLRTELPPEPAPAPIPAIENHGDAQVADQTAVAAVEAQPIDDSMFYEKFQLSLTDLTAFTSSGI